MNITTSRAKFYSEKINFGRIISCYVNSKRSREPCNLEIAIKVLIKYTNGHTRLNTYGHSNQEKYHRKCLDKYQLMWRDFYIASRISFMETLTISKTKHWCYNWVAVKKKRSKAIWSPASNFIYHPSFYPLTPISSKSGEMDHHYLKWSYGVLYLYQFIVSDCETHALLC